MEVAVWSQPAGACSEFVAKRLKEEIEAVGCPSETDMKKLPRVGRSAHVYRAYIHIYNHTNIYIIRYIYNNII